MSRPDELGHLIKARHSVRHLGETEERVLALHIILHQTLQVHRINLVQHEMRIIIPLTKG